MKKDATATVTKESASVTSSLFTSEDIQAVREYIKHTWQTLRRGHRQILSAAKDSKVEHKKGKAWPVYISRQEDLEQVSDTLETAMDGDFNRIRIETLPSEDETIEEHGLLYLPGDYVVPGGRFNELYGWDSYFIVRGLLQDDEVDLAKSVTDQLLYQVKHYGAVLNANRTYFLGRSQPPLLASMVLDVYAATQDIEWLSSTVPALTDYYQYWVEDPHLDPRCDRNTGLSRFYASGDGPAPEVIVSECDEEGRTHFDRIKEYYREHKIEDYDVSLFYDKEKDELTELFYKGDRTMRESGFDPTNRFGPFSVDIVHYLPVCLNSLLYQMSKDMVAIYQHLQQQSTEAASDVENLSADESDRQNINYSAEIAHWRQQAAELQHCINDYLWDEDSGLYLDYHFPTQKRRYYEYATTFYPLWTGLASNEQAERVVANLDKFEAPGGLRTSTHTSGNQWDDPFAWAPLQLIAVEGLHRYGYVEAANRLAGRFITMTVQDFERIGSFVEKYDVDARSSDVSAGIQYGYSSNEIGFGWTNGVVLSLLAYL
ncbi:MAG: trehalase family glycosidase [Cyanobacteria bacterium J06649_4]